MALYGFYVVADIRPNQGLTEKEVVLYTAERIVDVVEPRAFQSKVIGIKVEGIDEILAMTLPTVIPEKAQALIKRRREREHRQASPVSEIDRG